jgi:o-succinylbenzoate synthase
MRIVAACHREVRWPLVPRGAARRAGCERAALIVTVTSSDGACGLGEASPLPGMSADDLGDATRAANTLAARLPLDLATPAHASSIADRITPAPAARFAIETALLAAYAQQRRTSVAQLLVPVPQGEVRSAAVVDDEHEAQVAVALGARCLKIKVGGEPAADIERVLAIARRVLGVPLRLDANRGWAREDVAGILVALRGLPIDYVEEPCQDAHELLAHDLPCRIALDESLAELDRAQLARALASPRLAAVVLKPTLLGGFARCRELAAEAHRHGVAPVVSHTLEGPIGMAACRELARAIGADVPVGLAPHAALTHAARATWSQPSSV